MLRRVTRPWAVAALLAITFAAALSAPALAASPSPTATLDLVPGPPAGSWTDLPDDTGPIAASDFYGSGTSSPPGYIDAYGKGWTSTDVDLEDDLFHYTSFFWAAYALGSFKGDAQSDPDRTTFSNISGFGTGAFEVTYPADSDGYASDWIFFAQGDYMAAVAVWDKGVTGHGALLDQTTRQLQMVPEPTSELRNIGYGVLGGILAAALIVAVMGLSGVVIAVVLVRRRSSASRTAAYAVPYRPSIGSQLSDDRRYWWDGQSWHDTATRVPPGAPISPDGTRWWDGTTWREMPSAGGAPA
jgi:hypothetical protein